MPSYPRGKPVSPAQEVIDGMLLSDGGIHRSRSAGNAFFALNITGHEDWALRARSALAELGVNSSCYPYRSPLGKGRYFVQSIFDGSSEGARDYLNALKSKWYPNGTKEVPNDITLTPVVLAHWFMGDGSSTWNTPSKRSSTVWLSTYGFSISSIELLEEKLCESGFSDIGRAYNKRVKCGSGVCLYLRTKNSAHFLKYVNTLILPSFREKVKLYGE